MTKVYVTSFTEELQKTGPHIEIRFDRDPDIAARWDTREEAEQSCRAFNTYPGIRSDGQAYLYKDFAVEERPAGGFMVSSTAIADALNRVIS
jgi:hypothetical protein